MDRHRFLRAAKLTGRALLAVARVLITALIVVSDAILALAEMAEGPPVQRVRRRSWPKPLRERLRREQGGKCVYCGVRVTLTFSHVDHVIPVAQGGTNDEWNLQLLCPKCNGRKGDRNDQEYRRRLRTLISQTQGAIPERRIPQREFDRAWEATSDAPGYVRGGRRNRWTPAQRVNAACIGVGVLVVLLVYLPFQRWLGLDGGSGETLATVSVVLGVLAAGWMKLRAWYTGRGEGVPARPRGSRLPGGALPARKEVSQQRGSYLHGPPAQRPRRSPRSARGR